MGKPSSRGAKRRLSNISNNSLSDTLKMPPKNSKEWKRLNNKNQADIKRSITGLFKKLRESTASLNNNKSNESVIVLDDSVESPHSNKRKSTLFNRTVKRRQSLNGTVVEIRDDDLVTNNNPCTSIQTPKKTISPIHSSTPNDIKPKGENKSSEALNKDIINLTEETNCESYLTIDLTYNSDYNYNTKSENNTVIDLEHTTDSIASGSNNNSSMTDDSNVTVLERPSFNKKNILKYATHIGKLNASEKGRLLELLTENIINGCKYNKKLIKNLSNCQDAANQSIETVEDAYIKEVIVGQSSHNSIGSNIYNPERDARNKVGLRMIVIDGSNVAMEHCKGKGFSVKGLNICIDYFLKRGHVVKAFVPRFRCKFGKSSDPRLLDSLERKGYVVYTPSREVQGKTITPYDDRYIVQCAAEFDGVIVSGDNYRDIMHENPKWKFIIENRLLQFTWVNDMLMFPRDPLGRNGPTLEEFLRHTPVNVASNNKDLGRVLNAIRQGRLNLEEMFKNLNTQQPQKLQRKQGSWKSKKKNKTINNVNHSESVTNTAPVEPPNQPTNSGAKQEKVLPEKDKTAPLDAATPQMDKLIYTINVDLTTESPISTNKDENISQDTNRDVPHTQTDPQPECASFKRPLQQFQIPSQTTTKDDRFSLIRKIRKRINKRQKRQKRSELRRLKSSQARAVKMNSANVINCVVTQPDVNHCAQSTVEPSTSVPDFISIRCSNTSQGRVVYYTPKQNAEQSSEVPPKPESGSAPMTFFRRTQNNDTKSSPMPFGSNIQTKNSNHSADAYANSASYQQSDNKT